MREVRIVLVGERSVGKSSLILGLVSEEFSRKVPIRAEEITIPADVNLERVPSRIIDTSTREQSEAKILEMISSANVVIIVYSVVDPKSIEMVLSYWIPLINSSNLAQNNQDKIPIILAGNKSDLQNSSCFEQVHSMMKQFPEVETCIECSALNMQNVSEIFWYAQKAVLYPTSPLFVADKKQLTEPTKLALTRIFRICDSDNDGYLSDKELEAFQRRCFQIPLSTQSLQDIKYMVAKNTLDGITPNGLTLRGFLFLNEMFIRKGRHETTWAVLRCFGYDNKLKLCKEYISPKLNIQSGCSTELTSDSITFLKMLFDKFDLDKDGVLSKHEIANMFSTAPSLPWSDQMKNAVVTDYKDDMHLEGFISQWVLMTYFSPWATLEFLTYLGFTYEFGLGDVHGKPKTSSIYRSGYTESNSNYTPPNYKLKSRLHESVSNLYNYSSQTRLDVSMDASERVSQETWAFSDKVVENQASIGGDVSQRAPVWSQHQQWLVSTALKIMQEKRIDLHRKQTTRSVFLCRVYGAAGVGKSCFLQGLTNRSLNNVANFQRSELPTLTCAAVSVHNQVQDPRWLILQEIDEAWGMQMSDSEALSCDVVALLYDVTDPYSFKYVADLFLNYYKACQRRLPCVFIACKSDQSEVSQYYPLDPSEFCLKYHLSLGDPLKFSSSSIQTTPIGEKIPDVESIPRYISTICTRHSIYRQLTTLANYPHIRGMQLSQTEFAWKLGFAATVLAGFGFVAFKIIRPNI